MSEQRTEKPTPQRLRKAREQGQFPAAKEFVGSLQFLVVVLIATAWMGDWFEASRRGFRSALLAAFRPDWTANELIRVARVSVAEAFLPLAPAAGLLLVSTLVLQIASTNMGISLSRLTPNFSRFKPLAALKQIPRQNIPSMFQACIVLLIAGYFVWSIGQEHLATLLMLPLASVQAGLGVLSTALSQVLWRTTAVLLIIGAVELLRHRWLYHKDLAMTKQEIRQEHRDQEGDPQIKARIRRIRRDLLRRRMMQEVPTATAVIVNPTHFAVAIRYDSGAMASPRVVAKGKNYLAARIKEKAVENDVPIVENPPLARALYKAVEVGSEIPPDFYRAVAEILAYVYRMMGRRSA